LFHIGFDLKSETFPIESLQRRAFLQQEEKCRLFDKVDLPFFDVSVAQSPHAAKQVAQGNQGHEITMRRGAGRIVMTGDHSDEFGWKLPSFGNDPASVTMGETQ